MTDCDENLRDFCCDDCEGSGLEAVWSDVERGYFFINQPCPCCGGRGYVFERVEPIEEEDLDPV